MAFTLANWGRSSTSMNEPVYSLTSGTVVGAQRIYTYYAPGVAGVSGDTQATIAGASYFDSVVYDLQTSDIIYSFSVRDGTMVSLFVTVTGTVVTTTAFANVAPVGTADITNLAVTGAKIANATITDGKMVANTLTNASIAANTILSANMSPLVQKYAAVSLSAAQWNGMYAAPVVLVAAPGASLLHIVDRVIMRMTFVAAQYAAGGAVILQYDSTANGAGVNAASATIAAATVNGIAATSYLGFTGATAVTATVNAVNKALYISNQTGAFTTGDGTWEFHVWYRTVAAV